MKIMTALLSVDEALTPAKIIDESLIIYVDGLSNGDRIFKQIEVEELLYRT